MKDPLKIVAKWTAESTQAQGAWAQGIADQKTNPLEKAASTEAQNRYMQGTRRAVESGKMAAKLRAVPFETYKQQVRDKQGNYSTGIMSKAAQAKAVAHHQLWGPRYQEISDAVAAMPKGGKAAALARIGKMLDISMGYAGTL